jgi:hypothetical protein
VGFKLGEGKGLGQVCDSKDLWKILEKSKYPGARAAPGAPGASDRSKCTAQSDLKAENKADDKIPGYRAGAVAGKAIPQRLKP